MRKKHTCRSKKFTLKQEFFYGLHSNIPLCCVLQWLFEHYVIIRFLRLESMLDLPWRGWRYWRDASFGVDEKAQYWPCFLHTWLIERGWVKPRQLYVCDANNGSFGTYAVPCPKCLKGSR